MNENEWARIERIDALAARKLKQPGETRPATVVWDEAADEVDTFARDTLATQALVADMEHDGLL